MNTHEIIFSNQPKYRIGRHAIFWILFSLHFIIQNLMIGGPGEGKTSRTFLQSASHFLYFLPIYLLATYFLMEVLLPKLLFKKRYTAFALSFLFLFVLSFIAVYYAGLMYLHQSTGKLLSQITFNSNKYHAVVDGLFVPFMLFGIVTGIKFSKKWFLQQRQNEKLARQKLANELQLLKTSIHPRFLFYSLHTVEKHIERASAESPALILQLSDLLSYILYENDKNWVELEKELEVIRGYINLEEKSFEGKLLLRAEFPKNTNATFVIPCILLSFVESSFEYFLETRQQEPLLALTIWLKENTLHYQMTFSKSAKDADLPNEKFDNKQKQLQTQYNGLHQLRISSEGENILIDLKLPLYSGDLINLQKNTVLNEEKDLV
ncbi:sensor histidine kinase [Terrimonas alba]|uniref:sensor histidine kinase n=1 Tax=Terrimonas alba TaxID=3349636 RepID=UPI0035F4AD8A